MPKMLQKDEYLKTLSERKRKTRVFRDFQHTGLVIAALLNDQKHKALYIKLAKKIDKETLINIAKDVSSRKNISNKGAYFMELIKQKGLLEKLKNEKCLKKKTTKSGQLKLKMKKRF
jgi:hypothetical protein